MSHLYCQCQKQKHFSFINFRFRIESIVKSVCVVVLVVVSLHHQQSDNFCKIQKENAKWIEPYFMCATSLSFTLEPPTYVCAAVLWGQEGHVHCRVTPGWICSPGPLSAASCWSEELDKIELLDLWQLLFGGTVEVVTYLAPFQNLSWTDIAWHSRLITISVKNHLRYFAGLQQTQPLAWSTHFTSTLTRIWNADLEEQISLFNTTLWI
jgi:hypothetical protein